MLLLLPTTTEQARFVKQTRSPTQRNENLHKRAEITHTQRAVQSVTDMVQGSDL